VIPKRTTIAINRIAHFFIPSLLVEKLWRGKNSYAEIN